MIPTVNDDLNVDFQIVKQPSKTYALDVGNRQIKGFVDTLSAVEQAIYKILNTERYEYLIYSWNYGTEIGKLFGQPIPFVYAELERLVTEALLQDDRIISLEDFKFSSKKNTVTMTFKAVTTEGEVAVEKVVKI